MQHFRKSIALRNLFDQMKSKADSTFKKNKFNRWFYLGLFVSGFGLATFIAYNDPETQRVLRIVKSLWSIKSMYQKEKTSPELHKKAATALLTQVLENGGLWLKIGQTISSLHYILPDEWCSTFERCQDQVIPESMSCMEFILEQEFGVGSATLFKEFDHVPFACASMAQVHRAKLHDGTDVCVKIQYSRLKTNLITDYLLLAKFNEWIQRVFKQYNMSWLLKEFYDNITNEMDFVKEARNCDGVRDIFKNYDSWFSTPKIYWDLTTSKVITMELIDGIKITNVSELKKYGHDPKTCLNRVLKIYGEMIFQMGYFHADPHAGNIMIERTTGKVILLDHGLYQKMSDSFRQDYAEFTKAVYRKDDVTVKRLCERLSIHDDQELFVSILFSRFWKFGTGFQDDVVSSQTLPFLRVNNILKSSSKEMLLIYKTNHFLRDLVMRLSRSDFAFTRAMVGSAVHSVRSWSDLVLFAQLWVYSLVSLFCY